MFPVSNRTNGRAVEDLGWGLAGSWSILFCFAGHRLRSCELKGLVSLIIASMSRGWSAGLYCNQCRGFKVTSETLFL